MATLTKTTLEHPTQPVSARYGHMLTGKQPISRPVRRFGRSHGMGVKLTTPAGTPLSCQRHNGPWYNFILPAETVHLLLEVDTAAHAGKMVAELVLFIGEREQSLPIPSHPPVQDTDEASMAPLQIDLPHFPHWVPGLLCIRLAQAQQNHAEQAA